MLVNGGRAYLKLKDGLFDPHFTPTESAAFKARLDHAVLLGFDARGPRIVVPAGIEPDDLPPTIKAIDYRSIYVQGLIPPADLGALAQGASLLAWHTSHRFCSKCGHESEMRHGGYRRVCGNCGTEHFPRTDPVAIMLTVSGEKCLLGRSPRFVPGTYSCLAGFIEPGETIENAVRRETLEEAGIRLGRVLYQASQPALAVSLFADDRLLWRGAERGHPPRPQRAGGLPLVFARRSPRHHRRKSRSRHHHPPARRHRQPPNPQLG
jgi:NAD+ diphosphatase